MNDKLILNRIKPDDGKETQGVLSIYTGIQSILDADTIERPWLNNQHGISCIPSGIYPWKKVPASHHIPYEHISIENVPDRDRICIHILNFALQSNGCIGVGKKVPDMNGDGEADISESKKTFDKLMALLPEKGTINII